MAPKPPRPPEEAAAQAHALVERLFALLFESRSAVLDLEPGHDRQETEAQAAERLVYFGLVGAIEAGVVRTAEDVLSVLKQAQHPIGPMGETWLREQERRLTGGGNDPAHPE